MVTTAKTAQLRNWFGYRPSWKRYTLCLIITFSFCQFVGISTTTAATYYVDAVNGSDTNPGDSTHPWKTMARAMDSNMVYPWVLPGPPTAGEGDIVYFKNGNYGRFYENSQETGVIPTTRTNWITYKAAVGHTPELSGIYIRNDKGGYSGQSYLKFEGFNVVGANSVDTSAITIKYTGYVEINDCNITQYSQPYSGTYSPYFWPTLMNVEIDDSNQVTIAGCTIHNGFRGITVNETSSDINIINNTVYHLGEDGIDILSKNTLLQNNLVYDIHEFRVPINFGGTITGSFALGDAVTLNSNPVATGIVCRVSSVVEIWPTSAQSFFDGTVRYDHLRGTTITGPNGTLTNINYADGAHCDGMTVGQGSAGYTCPNTIVNGNKIIRNLPGDEGLEFGSQALKLDGPQHIIVSNNLLVSTPGGGSIGTQVALLMGGGTTDFNLVNNTMVGMMLVRNLAPGPTLNINNMFNNIISSLVIDNDGACKPHIVNHGNNIFGNNPNGTGGPTYPFVVSGTELVNSNISSLFTNAANNDFNLAPNSIAINFGNPSYAPATDILGHSRDSSPDAGCYEYVSSQSSNKPPNADAGQDQTVTALDQSSVQVTLDGSGSSDPDGSIVSYVWSEGISQIATGVNPTVSLPVGRHTITLKVTDNSDLNDTDTVVITVEAEEGDVGLWKFDDGSGLYAKDSSGYGITGRLINGPLWTTQGEISFDGNNDAVEINTATLNISSGTVTLWINPKGFSKSKHYLFGHITQPANNRIQLFCNAEGTLGVGLGDNASVDTNIQTLNTQEWYHIALTWSNTSYAVFVDGQQKASGTFSGISDMQTYADIGNSGNRSQLSEAFYGLIDEVRLYNRPLDANEIANHALVFLPVGNKTVAEGETLTFPIKTKFGTIVDISDSNLPYSPSFSSNIFTWTPGYDDAGTYEVEFAASHGSGEDFERITVTVMDTQQQEPVGNWKFDELSGDIASDSSTTGNTGYLRNGLVWGQGKHNGAIMFSVPNDAVEIQTTKLNPQFGTIAMWVYMNRQTLSRHYLFGQASPTLTNRIQLYLKYGNLCLGLGNSHETRMDIQQLQTQQWYHIALTWSEGNYNVYVNGTLMAYGTYSGLMGLSDHADIGNNGITRDKALNGSIDDVMVYNRALTADEIVQLATN